MYKIFIIKLLADNQICFHKNVSTIIISLLNHINIFVMDEKYSKDL